MDRSIGIDDVQIPPGRTVVFSHVVRIRVLKNGQIGQVSDLAKAADIGRQVDDDDGYIRQGCRFVFPELIERRNLRLTVRSTRLGPVDDDDLSEQIILGFCLAECWGARILID